MASMKPSRNLSVVLVTAPDLRTARVLAKAALRARLAACVNLVPKIESHYWWQGKLERSAEVLMVLKTAEAKLPALERCLRAHHPYDTPEFLALPPHATSRRYAEWLIASVK